MTKIIQTAPRKLKDPGSAITHFIGMMMALFAATPLLIKATREPDRIHLISLTIFIVSMILLYAASTTYHSLDLSERMNRILRKIDHMMIFVLIAGTYTPICLVVLNNQTGYFLCALVWGNRPGGHPGKSLLDHLSEMVFLRSLYRHGLGMRAGLHPDRKCTFPGPAFGGCWRAASSIP